VDYERRHLVAKMHAFAPFGSRAPLPRRPRAARPDVEKARSAVRRNAFLLTMGLAGSLFASGCQQRPLASPRALAAASAPTNYNVRVTTDPVKPSAPVAAAPVHVPPSRGYVTEAPVAPPASLPPAALQSPHLADKARTAPIAPVPTAPAAAPAPRPQPVSRPVLPPPPAPESLPPSKQTQLDRHTDTGTLIISEQANDHRPLMSVAKKTTNKTTAPPAPVAQEIASSAPKEGLCTLTGEAQEFRKGWRLRYASVEAEDAHGGSVALVGENLQRLRDGQTVRVVGTLQPAEDRLDTPRFLVHFLEVIAP
jgi:hypothetical protein